MPRVENSFVDVIHIINLEFTELDFLFLLFKLNIFPDEFNL